MILLTVGDSWTQGDSPAQDINWEAEQNIDWYHIPPHFGLTYTNKKTFNKKVLNKFYDSEVWPKVIGRNLGIKTYNAGRLGADNGTILKTTINSINYIKNENKINFKDIFVIIGLTSKYRSHLVEKDQTKNKFSIQQFNFGQFTAESFKNISFNYFMDEFCLQIYTLQNWLDELGIKYLIFNAFENQNDVVDSCFYNFKLDNFLDESLEFTFREYIEKKFNTEWSNQNKYFKTNHPTDFSHIEWGNYLTEYIEDRKLL